MGLPPRHPRCPGRPALLPHGGGVSPPGRAGGPRRLRVAGGRTSGEGEGGGGAPGAGAEGVRGWLRRPSSAWGEPPYRAGCSGGPAAPNRDSTAAPRPNSGVGEAVRLRGLEPEQFPLGPCGLCCSDPDGKARAVTSALPLKSVGGRQVAESVRLEKVSEMIESNLWHNTTLSTTPGHCHIQSFLKQLWGWWIYHLLGSPFQYLITLSVKNFFQMSILNLLLSSKCPS